MVLQLKKSGIVPEVMIGHNGWVKKTDRSTLIADIPTEITSVS